MKKIWVIVVTLTAFATIEASAQKSNRIYAYDFKAALVEYSDSIAAGKDSSLYKDVIKDATTCLEMTGLCHSPKVVARKRFGKSDFFLFYPLLNKTWRPTQYKGVYVCDAEVKSDTVRKAALDSLEYFPFVSGNEKYFSSKSLIGAGGYDLYVSRWNEKTKAWDAPENLGFPYSSPYDDFLFVNTEDGRYSVFASNRDCPEDSVNVYVVEYESVKVRKQICNPSELQTLCRLDPAIGASVEGGGLSGKIGAAPDESTRKYLDKISHIRRLRDTIAINDKHLEALRDNYSSAPAEKKDELAQKITNGEQKAALLRTSMEAETKALRVIEMDFLMNGVAIDIEKLIAESNRVVELSETGYTFTKKDLGNPVTLIYLKFRK